MRHKKKHTQTALANEVPNWAALSTLTLYGNLSLIDCDNQTVQDNHIRSRWDYHRFQALASVIRNFISTALHDNLKTEIWRARVRTSVSQPLIEDLRRTANNLDRSIYLVITDEADIR